MEKNKYIVPSCSVYEIKTQGLLLKPTSANIDESDLPDLNSGGTITSGTYTAD